jgi:hypothetical protein
MATLINVFVGCVRTDSLAYLLARPNRCLSDNVMAKQQRKAAGKWP